MSEEIAILHDQFRTRGGAERVAFELARTFDAPILAARIDEGVVPEDIDAECIVNSRLGHRAMRSHYLGQDLYQMLRWQHVERAYEFDTLIVNKTNPGWFVPRDDQTTVWYLHSTPRGQYDQFHRRGRNWLSRLLKTPMRPLYRPNIAYADAWACNSDLTQRRMDRYWDIAPERVDVVYPPVGTDAFSPDDAPTEGFYLCLSRLHSHKRIGDVIQAINTLNRSPDGREYRLVVAGEGPDRERLEELAGPHVEFRGYVDESEKRRLMAGAKALVFAAENEDFGIVPIEAMAAGTPVLGVDDGFTQFQVRHNENGMLFPRDGGHLRETIRAFDQHGVTWSPAQIESYADQFSAARVQEEMRAVVDRAQERATIRPDVDVPDRVGVDTPVVADGGAE